MEAAITRFTTFMSTTAGFVATNSGMGVLSTVTLIGVISVDDYTLILSIAAIVLTAAVLVASRRDTEAIQLKLDEIVKALPAASNRVVGIEKES